MFELALNEIVTAAETAIAGSTRQLHICSQCDQIAFRVLRLKSQGGERTVALCGFHLVDACARYPELRHAITLHKPA